MRFVTVLVVMIFALTGSISAQGRGQGQAKKTTVSAPKAKSTETPKHTTTKTTKTEARAAKAEARTTKATTKAETRAAKADAKTARKSPTTTTTTTTTDVASTTPTSLHVKNPKLEARLLALLPGVTDINLASQGFKNWGQFVAAAHVSNNLGIPFADLKARMTGIAPGATVPTTAPMSLGQAIQSWTGTTTQTGTLTPTTIQTEVKKAEDAANADLRNSRGRS